uniref:RepB/MobA n=1 Tax=Acidiphilium multivorum TaxID=62140 RepID=Q19QS6_ACIMU|nr:MobA/MobL family protein [Acidiphilium multivorum]ABF71733.2 RepB/MobA [Acidiphilium multivorum]
MAIYHASVKVVGRGGGRSSVAASAYRSGECLTNERDGNTHDYTKKQGVVHREIMTPENAPAWMSDRSKLWNGVEAAEKRKDAQLFRDVEIALPRELSREELINLVRDFVKERCVTMGWWPTSLSRAPRQRRGEATSCPHHADHAPHRGRELGNKAREWNPDFATKDGKGFVKDKSPLLGLREGWAEHINRALERAHIAERVDHRSLTVQREVALEMSQDQTRPEPERLLAERCAQDLDREPQPKLGAAAAMERRGVQTDRGDQMRAVQGRNRERQGVWQQVREWGAQALDKARDWAVELRERLAGVDLSGLRTANLSAALAGADLFCVAAGQPSCRRPTKEAVISRQPSRTPSKGRDGPEMDL